MDNCSFDFSFKELESIRLFADTELAFFVPLALYRPTITDTEFAFINNGQNNPPEGIEILSRIDTISPPEVSQEISTSGKKHTVKLTYTADRSSESSQAAQLLSLHSNWYHILLTYSDGNRALVRATEDSFTFDSQESDTQTKCTITITNPSGIQRIVSASNS